MEKWLYFHKCLLTQAMASEKVGCSLAYQAAVRTTLALVFLSHPEGRAFVEQLRVISDLFVKCLPNGEEF